MTVARLLGEVVAVDALAPTLELLHARQAARGHLSEQDVREVADGVGLVASELYGVIRAYPRFRLEPGAPGVAVCGGPACRMHGADAAKEAIPGATFTACLGLCDQPVAVLTAHGPRVLRLDLRGTGSGGPHLTSAAAVGEARSGGAPEPRLPISTLEPSCFFAPEDPFDAVAMARGEPPEAVIAVVGESGLQGRGGAGFPVGRKWQMVHEAAGASKVVICNADESEPGAFKDRSLLDHQPRRLLAGMAIAAHAIGASQGLIYLRREYQSQCERLTAEISSLRSEGQLGDSFDVAIRRGGGLYVCGEETALLNSLEGRRPIPRDRPPFPPTAGLYGWPTLVQNVESLSAVPAIVTRGPAWFRSSGMPKLYCVSGDIPSPGVIESSLGITVQDLLRRMGARIEDVKAFTLGGLSGGLLPSSAIDLPLDFDAPRRRGAYLGSGGLVVLGHGRCIVRFVAQAMRFFADESCGKCFPCRIGTTRLHEQFDRLGRYAAFSELDLHDITDVLTSGSACGLGPAAALVARHAVTHFGPEIEAHARGHCISDECTR